MTRIDDVRRHIASRFQEELINCAQHAKNRNSEEINAYCKQRSSDLLAELDEKLKEAVKVSCDTCLSDEQGGASNDRSIKYTKAKKRFDNSHPVPEVVSQRLAKSQALMHCINGYDCYDKTHLGVVPKEIHPFDLSMEIALAKAKLIFGSSLK